MPAEEEVIIRVRYDIDDSELQRSIREAGGLGASGGGAGGAIGWDAAPGGGGGGGGGTTVVPGGRGGGGGGGLLAILGKLVAILGVMELATDAFSTEMTDAKDIAKQFATETNLAAQAAANLSRVSGARGRATDIQAITQAAEGVPAGFGLLTEGEQLDLLAAQASVNRVGIEGKKRAEEIRRFQMSQVQSRMSNIQPTKGNPHR